MHNLKSEAADFVPDHARTSVQSNAYDVDSGVPFPDKASAGYNLASGVADVDVRIDEASGAKQQTHSHHDNKDFNAMPDYAFSQIRSNRPSDQQELKVECEPLENPIIVEHCSVRCELCWGSIVRTSCFRKRDHVQLCKECSWSQQQSLLASWCDRKKTDDSKRKCISASVASSARDRLQESFTNTRAAWATELRNLIPPKNSYQLFLNDEKHNLIGSVGQQAVTISKMWAELDSERRQTYESAAARARDAYKGEVARLKALLKP